MKYTFFIKDNIIEVCKVGHLSQFDIKAFLLKGYKAEDDVYVYVETFTDELCEISIYKDEKVVSTYMVQVVDP